MDYYKRALSGPIRRQAILRADWASAHTLAKKMTIATLASQQLDEANGVSHSKHLHTHSSQQMVSVPTESDAMEVDVIGLSSHPSTFPKKTYIDECKRLKLCTRCLGPYNDTHRTSSGSATCPNAVASLQAKIDFVKNSRKNTLPKSVSHPPPGPPQPVHRPVAAVAAPTPPPPELFLQLSPPTLPISFFLASPTFTLSFDAVRVPSIPPSPANSSLVACSIRSSSSIHHGLRSLLRIRGSL